MDLFKESFVLLDKTFTSKDDLFEEISNVLHNENRVTSAEAVKKAFIKREEEITTGIGGGIAIPHAKDISVIFPTLIYIKLQNELKYNSLDSKPVKHVFSIAMPSSYHKEHLTLLAKIATILQDQSFLDSLESLKETKDILELINNSLV